MLRKGAGLLGAERYWAWRGDYHHKTLFCLSRNGASDRLIVRLTLCFTLRFRSAARSHSRPRVGGILGL